MVVGPVVFIAIRKDHASLRNRVPLRNVPLRSRHGYLPTSILSLKIKASGFAMVTGSKTHSSLLPRAEAA
jgi:hypothetical protein